MVNAVMGMVVVVLFVVVFVGMVVVVTYVSVTYVLLPSVSGIGVPSSSPSTIAKFFSGLAQARPKKKLAIAAFEGGLPGGYPSNTGAPGAVALPLPGFKPFLSTDGGVVDASCRGCWRGCQPRQQPKQAPSTAPGCSGCCATGVSLAIVFVVSVGMFVLVGEVEVVLVDMEMMVFVCLFELALEGVVEGVIWVVML